MVEDAHERRGGENVVGGGEWRAPGGRCMDRSCANKRAALFGGEGGVSAEGRSGKDRFSRAGIGGAAAIVVRISTREDATHSQG